MPACDTDGVGPARADRTIRRASRQGRRSEPGSRGRSGRGAVSLEYGLLVAGIGAVLTLGLGALLQDVFSETLTCLGSQGAICARVGGVDPDGGGGPTGPVTPPTENPPTTTEPDGEPTSTTTSTTTCPSDTSTTTTTTTAADGSTSGSTSGPADPEDC